MNNSTMLVESGNSSNSSQEDNMSSLTMSNNGHCLLDVDTYQKSIISAYEAEDSADSSGEECGGCGGGNFFEGAEKRLVIYLADNKQQQANKAQSVACDRNLNSNDIQQQQQQPDLRTIPRVSWEMMLDLVNCRILNVISNEHIDAYLLSESSMFVSKNRIIVKTCGSTTLLHCLESILQLVKQAGFETVEDVFYSHKNLLVPSLQMHPHHSFLKESDYLDKLFNGHSHLFGHVNSDRFYLYTLDNNFTLANENEHFKFEIIMEDLDEKVMSLFIRPIHNGMINETLTGAEITRKSGIDKLIPGMVIDDFLFSPCGYSMNGILKKHYMTIHITPEADFSYVSLEMNVPQTNYPNFIRKVINLFKPSKFMLNLTVPDLRQVAAKAKQRLLSGIKAEPAGQKPIESTMPNGCDENQLANIHGLVVYEDLLGVRFTEYRRRDLQLAHYKHSDIVYARYVAEGIS